MKKIITIFLLNLIFILTSCATTKFNSEKEKLAKINKEDYLTEIEENGINKTIYQSENTDRVYYLFEDNNSYKMVIQDSYYSKGILEYNAKEYEKDPEYLDYSISKEEVIYDKSSKELTNKSNIETKDLNKEGFII